MDMLCVIYFCSFFISWISFRDHRIVKIFEANVGTLRFFVILPNLIQWCSLYDSAVEIHVIFRYSIDFCHLLFPVVCIDIFPPNISALFILRLVPILF